ncbi:TPA: hypothetical protein ACH3X1_003951 [Trebouxia sp. C0004]
MVRIQTYLHHPTYGQVRSLPDAVRAVKGRHSSGAPAVNASLAPTSAIVDNAKPEYQSAGFGCPIAKAFFKNWDTFNLQSCLAFFGPMYTTMGSPVRLGGTLDIAKVSRSMCD